MKENKEGEELIDLDELESPNKTKNSDKKSKKFQILNKSKIQLIIIILIFFLFIIIYFFEKKRKIVKSLIIFDFDKTITLNDVFEEQRFLLPSKEEQDEIMDKLYYENWTSLMSSFYERIFELNISISDINNYIDTIDFNPGMIELLKYFENRKQRYSLVVLSAGHYLQVMRMLERFNLSILFDEIITIPSHIENGKIIITQRHNYICDICNVGQCKTHEYNLLIEMFKKTKNIIFDKVYYICDGLNDFCLARNLKKNDILFVKKGLSLYKALFEQGMINNITSKFSVWDNGFELLKYFKDIER